MSFFHSDSKTGITLRCDYCIKFQLFGGAQDFLVDWWLFVTCFCPIPPTEYCSTTRGMSVGPPVAINIDFCGNLGFFSISFVWTIQVRYATGNLSGQQLVFVSQASVDIQPTVDSSASDKCDWTILVSWERNIQLLCFGIQICVLEGFRRWKGSFWLHKETLTFKGPAA